MSRRTGNALVTKSAVSAYTVPADAPEGDGTFDWHDTTFLLVETTAGNRVGLGYSYTDAAAAKGVETMIGRAAVNVPGIHLAMLERMHNLDQPGLGLGFKRANIERYQVA